MTTTLNTPGRYMNMECCCHEKTKHRTAQEQKNLTNRLSRIEGQVRGLRDMLQDEPHTLHVILGIAPVAQRRKVAEIEFLLLAFSKAAFRRSISASYSSACFI